MRITKSFVTGPADSALVREGVLPSLPNEFVCYGIEDWNGYGSKPNPVRNKRVAVVGCGPSAIGSRNAWCNHDEIIAINRSVLLLDRGWWCFADSALFAGNIVDPSAISIFTCRTADTGMRDQYREYYPQHRSMTWESLGYSQLGADACHGFSVIAALFLAASLGAASIDLFGADWSGINDFDGRRTANCWRSPMRWEIERWHVGLAFDALSALGIQCTRIEGTA